MESRVTIVLHEGISKTQISAALRSASVHVNVMDLRHDCDVPLHDNTACVVGALYVRNE